MIRMSDRRYTQEQQAELIAAMDAEREARMYEEQGPEQASRRMLSAELAAYVARAQSEAGAQ
jgi:hypothetical protein